jgi:type IV fimbrial biogenesis protein FimT
MSAAPAKPIPAVSPSTSRRLARAFTLVELIITIAVVAVLTAIALPSFREIGIRMNVTSTTNDVVGALNTARSEAVKRGLPVAVVSVISGGGNWTSGWTINADTARDGTYITILATHAAVPATYSLAAKATGAGGLDDRAAFSATGNLALGTLFDFSVCRPTSAANIAQSRRINVKGSGEISSHRDVTGSPAGTC